MTKSRKNQPHSSLETNWDCCDATFAGLGHWYKHLFEQLGWMVLAKRRGLVDKTSVYKNSLKRFKISVEKKMAGTKDKDRKDDLKIMHDNICILIAHADMDL